MAPPLPREAPDEAAILLGFDPPDGARPDRAAAVRALQRQIADCGRYGFARAHVLHPPGLAGLATEAIGTLPALAPLPAVAARLADTALAGLAALADGCAGRMMVLSENALLEANWLALMAQRRDLQSPPAGTICLVASSGEGPGPGGSGGLGAPALAASFTLAQGLAQPATPGRTEFVFCGLALITCAALRGAGGTGDFQAFLTRLASEHRLGAWQAPADALLAPSGALPLRTERPALFLDRDGTLNEDYGYVSDPARIALLPGAARAVKRANDLGFYVFLVTNQSGVGRGYYREADVHLCNAALQRLLRAEGAHVDDIRYAIDHPDVAAQRGDGGWRKPEPGMLLDLMAHWPVDRDRSLMVGDKTSDVEAGRAAGIAAVKFEGGDLDALLAPLLEARAPGHRS